jgi:hypothetical protein
MPPRNADPPRRLSNQGQVFTDGAAGVDGGGLKTHDAESTVPATRQRARVCVLSGSGEALRVLFETR